MRRKPRQTKYLWSQREALRQKWLEGKTPLEALEVLDLERVPEPYALDFVRSLFEVWENAELHY